MEIPSKIYLALLTMTEQDCNRLKYDMPESDKLLMEECQEITGKHKSDYDFYDVEMPFASNSGNEDWLEP
jgi:hypothetical protein